MTPFGIIMPNFNKGWCIGQAIDSVLLQRDHDWKLVIADDGSTDNSIHEIAKRSDPRITVLHVAHGGPGHASKAALADIRSLGVEWVGILDSDDALHEDAVRVVRKAHEDHPDCGLIYTQNWMCDPDLKPMMLGKSRRIPEGETVLGLMDQGDPLRVAHWKTFKLGAYDKTEGFKVLARHQDMDLVLKLEEVTKLFYVDQPLYSYRLLEDGLHTGTRIADFSYQIKDAARARRAGAPR